jgi:hypothetical protein
LGQYAELWLKIDLTYSEKKTVVRPKVKIDLLSLHFGPEALRLDSLAEFLLEIDLKA